MSKKEKRRTDSVPDSVTPRLAYEKAREEILHRIDYRDRVLLLYLGAIATTFGAVLAMEKPEYSVLYIAPFLSVGAGLLVYQHNISISDLVSFIRRKLAGPVPTFETFNLTSSEPRGLKIRSAGEIILLVVPCLACLAINCTDLTAGWSSAITWIGSGVATIAVLLISLHMAYARSAIAKSDRSQVTGSKEHVPAAAVTWW